ncbi:ABC transporter substrate-binding protein [Salimicrobium flavidum]|uniref:Putative spermidine/putrescine transport system substrate-binding protein n=1 Tax=Salimicrobium flavidum TaxID=570947 RepID=A0A1N7J982_9BACI|nr:ABC transporter substrate-binding protein [Salimicrobium flavidum]SIS45892.1 putative spermidine/putrescine transport system substrate-binding protein [Salimicrobium flavidum]
MKKWLLVIVMLLVGCNDTSEGSEDDISDMNFDDIETSAQNTEVNLFMWGGDDGINTYIDEWVAPRLEENHDINLTRTPMDTGDILQKLRTERQAGKQEGTIDIIWVNGENFKNAKENELLYGSFRDKLPNFRDYYDKEEFTHDFGTETEGMEAPWGKVQFALQYDAAKVKNPPETYEELTDWVEANPGEFTYPTPSDFTGNAFLRQMLLATAEDAEALTEQSFDRKRAENYSDAMWNDLNEWKPHLFREGEYYPSSLSELDRLYSEGKVSMTMGYNEARSEHLINDGVFPDTTETFVMDSGSLGNAHFLSIPFNSTNVPGALTTINYLLSPEAQLQKMRPSSWGDNTAIAIERLPEDMQMQFEELDRGETVPSAERLREAFRPELDTDYLEWMTKTWEDEVVRTP